ncbi:MAG: glycerol kinase GlpK [Rhodothermia bacterium]|nr:glycerol kinase GlpK [Rhodothermia bacterium]
MQVKYVLALDQGTTSSRALIFDQTGQIVGVSQREFDQIFPESGWVEHNADEIWESQYAVAKEAIRKAGLSASDISAIGITNQRETTVVWDRNSGDPICNAIVWQDRRTAGYCDQLKAQGLEAEFRQRTGLVVDAYFSGTKVRWILENVEGARERAEDGSLAFGTIDSWLVWKLTEGALHITDVSNASRTLMYNIHDLQWDETLLEVLSVPSSMLPDVRQSSEVYGSTASGLFEADIPIAGIAGDQQSALFGQLCTQPGMVKNTYGTGCFMLVNTGADPVASHNNLLTTIAWQLDGETTYALEGSVFIGGAVVQWLRDGLGLIQDSGEVEALAGSVEGSDGVYLVPAFTGLGAPHWDPYARGTIVGLTRGSSAAHLARAALESIAFQSADLVHSMEADSGVPVRELRVDGGAAANNLLMQFQADLLGVPVVRPTVLETTALGAAYLAGLGVGVWPNTSALAEQWQVDRRFDPSMDRGEVDRLVVGWNRALQRARGWLTPDS